MIICRNCRCSWPDDCKFCGMCGYQIGELAEEGTAQSAPAVPWWSDATQTDVSSHQVHGDHHQPLLTHPQHHQSFQVDDTHHQSVADHSKDLKNVQKRYHPSILVKIVSLLIFLGIAVIALVIVYFNLNNVTATPPVTTTLEVYGKAILGQTLQVVGKHFTPSQTVFVTIDSQPLVKNGPTTYTWHSSVLSLSMISLSPADSGGTPVTVQADGTFTIEIHVDIHWTIGSTHHLRVNNQQGNEIRSLYFTVEPDQSMPTPTLAPPTYPTPMPPTDPMYPTYPTPIPTYPNYPTPTPTYPTPTLTTTTTPTLTTTTTPTPTPTPTPTSTPTPTPTPTPTSTPTPTPTPQPTPMPTSTPTYTTSSTHSSILTNPTTDR